MARGRLERLLAQGFIEGWAVDEGHPTRARLVAVRLAEGAEIARGYACLYRETLARAGIGLGWCAFRLRLSEPAERFARARLDLIDVARGERIDSVEELFLAYDRIPDSEGQGNVIHDPFVLRRVQQLQSCEDLFEDYIERRGLAAFIGVAHVYVLGRGAEPESLALYDRMFQRGALTPYGLIELLTETQEYDANPRKLAAPIAPAFPFATVSDV